MNRLEYIHAKIVSLEEAKLRVEQWRVKNDRIAFTNGCFDILHQGHVTYLAQSAGYGNRLVVGLNTDASVRRQGKGEDRPVNSENARALVLAALGCVDMVVLFENDTPLNLIEALRPDVLLKGADYDPQERNPESKKYIVGSDCVLAAGGKVVAVPLVDGFSTTGILNRLKG